jgi:integrase
MARKKAWSKTITERGVELRLYERPGGVVWCSRVVGRKDGRTEKRRISLKTKDHAAAETKARELAAEIALAELTGIDPAASRLSVGELRRLYLHHRGPLLSKPRQQQMERVLDLFVAHLGAAFPVEDFGEHQADTYLAARRSNRLAPDDRRAREHPSNGTLRNELAGLSTACNWATRYRVNGTPLLGTNPVRSVTPPKELNPARPRMSRERYEKLLKVADQVEAEGRLRVLLMLAWHTGRRINAILHLRASDVLTDPAAMRPILAACGHDEADADEWPGALHWRPEWDKKGYRDTSPIGEALRATLTAYAARRGVIGEGWLFPMPSDASRPMSKLLAGYYLKRAEQAAGLESVHRLGWHGFRRAWATQRKAFPMADVARAGGWRDLKALQEAYSQADARTTLQVMEHAG